MCMRMHMRMHMMHIHMRMHMRTHMRTRSCACQVKSSQVKSSQVVSSLAAAGTWLLSGASQVLSSQDRVAAARAAIGVHGCASPTYLPALAGARAALLRTAHGDVMQHGPPPAV